MVILTIFTPAYNRAHTLTRTYESLKNQSCKEFIWLIVNDGSTDDTEKLVKMWQKEESTFEIRYLYKNNGGMHTAHNAAYEIIDTELNMCIDSDDKLAEDAVARILRKWEEVKGKGFAGIIGLDADFSGNVMGTRFDHMLSETTLMKYYAQGGSGDKKLVYRTDVINEVPPYPIFEGEKYVALAYKYRLIDQKYKLAVLNEILCNVEYQQDGSTKNMYEQYVNNPKGFAFWRKVCMKYPESYGRLFVDCIHYVSSSLIDHNKYFILESPRKFLTILAIPFGIVLTLFIRMKVKND